MKIMRAALEEMALGFDPGIVRGMDSVMDKTFARFDGPFHSFEDSLIAFARANYALRPANGRCMTKRFDECQGLYFDPNGLYLKPNPDAERNFDGGELQIGGTVPNSYGMDFVEVGLEPARQGQSLTVSFQGEGEVARFNVQIWGLVGVESKPTAITPQPESVSQNANGAHVYVIRNRDVSAFDRLALIITRLDADETTDPNGDYTITLGSTRRAENVGKIN
jgi:hypothetical protein